MYLVAGKCDIAFQNNDSKFVAIWCNLSCRNSKEGVGGNMDSIIYFSEIKITQTILFSDAAQRDTDTNPKIFCQHGQSVISICSVLVMALIARFAASSQPSKDCSQRPDDGAIVSKLTEALDDPLMLEASKGLKEQMKQEEANNNAHLAERVMLESTRRRRRAKSKPLPEDMQEVMAEKDHTAADDRLGSSAAVGSGVDDVVVGEHARSKISVSDDNTKDAKSKSSESESSSSDETTESSSDSGTSWSSLVLSLSDPEDEKGAAGSDACAETAKVPADNLEDERRSKREPRGHSGRGVKARRTKATESGKPAEQVEAPADDLEANTGRKAGGAKAKVHTTESGEQVGQGEAPAAADKSGLEAKHANVKVDATKGEPAEQVETSADDFEADRGSKQKSEKASGNDRHAPGAQVKEYTTGICEPEVEASAENLEAKKTGTKKKLENDSGSALSLKIKPGGASAVVMSGFYPFPEPVSRAPVTNQSAPAQATLPSAEASQGAAATSSASAALAAPSASMTSAAPAGRGRAANRGRGTGRGKQIKPSTVSLVEAPLTPRVRRPKRPKESQTNDDSSSESLPQVPICLSPPERSTSSKAKAKKKASSKPKVPAEKGKG